MLFGSLAIVAIYLCGRAQLSPRSGRSRRACRSPTRCCRAIANGDAGHLRAHFRACCDSAVFMARLLKRSDPHGASFASRRRSALGLFSNRMQYGVGCRARGLHRHCRGDCDAKWRHLSLALMPGLTIGTGWISAWLHAGHFVACFISIWPALFILRRSLPLYGSSSVLAFWKPEWAVSSARQP